MPLRPPKKTKDKMISAREAAKIIGDCAPDDLYKFYDYGLVVGGWYDNGRRWFSRKSVVKFTRNRNKQRGQPDG